MILEKILVVDDNAEIADLTEKLLQAEGYEVIKAYSGMEALEKFTDDILLVILDVMMPGMDGCEVCRRIRGKSNVPVLYLSAKGTDIDKVVGLSAGGDDYMVKPFSSIELVARVKALIRRYCYLRGDTSNNEIIQNGEKKAKQICIDTLAIDETSHTVWNCDKELNLTRTEYEILLLFATHRGQVFSTEQIFQNVWKEKYFEGNNTVMVHLARLRGKIEEDPKNPKIIKNVWGVGYKIEA